MHGEVVLVLWVGSKQNQGPYAPEARAALPDAHTPLHLPTASSKHPCNPRSAPGRCCCGGRRGPTGGGRRRARGSQRGTPSCQSPAGGVALGQRGVALGQRVLQQGGNQHIHTWTHRPTKPPTHTPASPPAWPGTASWPGTVVPDTRQPPPRTPPCWQQGRLTRQGRRAEAVGGKLRHAFAAQVAGRRASQKP